MGSAISCGGRSNSFIFRYRSTRPRSFFAPLRNWRRPEGSHLYLGLLQFNDEAGNRARIGAAQRVVDDFGVAAECGFGRTDPSRMPMILAGHRAAAQSLAEIR